MPDVPATGPTDPEAVLRAIHLGAEPYQGHLRTLRSGERWLAVVDGEHGPEWILTRTKGVGVSEDDFDRIARGRVQDGLVHVDGERYELVPPKPSDTNQTAVLVAS